MNAEATRRGLQFFLTALGAVAVIAGGLAMVFGVALVPDAGNPSASVDSEVRFFAAWYAAAGVVLLCSVTRVESAGRVIRTVGGSFFAAGCARLLSLIVVGRPHSLFLVLMVVEMALPVLMVPWHTSVARKWSRSGRDR